MPEVLDLRCPGCAAPLDYSITKCAYCGRPIVISSFASAKSIGPANLARLKQGLTNDLQADPFNGETNKSLGIVFLTQGVFDKAYEKLNAAIELGFDDSEVYYYTAIALLGGQKPNLLSREANERAKQYVRAAINLESRGVYWYLMAYINYDYYARKHLYVTPDYEECLNAAIQTGIPEHDIIDLFEMLRQQVPEAIRLVYQ